MHCRPAKIDLPVAFSALRQAAADNGRVVGLTHRYYKYPARFSPTFVAAAIEMFSSRNDIVLDPYMGGGTTIVEAMVSGRIAIGCDINSLAVFVAKAKTALLTRKESDAIESWAHAAAASISYREMVKT